MKTRLCLLFASTTLTLALGLPAFARMHDRVDAADGRHPGVAAPAGEAHARPLVRLSEAGDDEDDEDGRACGGHDDDCDNEDDDHEGTGGTGNPAPAGSVAPPANGLFGTGAPPAAVTK